MKTKAKAAAKKPARGGKRAPRRGFRKARDVPDYALLSATSTLTPPPGNPNFLTNTLYNMMNIQLSTYDRAVAVASAYQHYRIKKITFRFRPTADTYAQGGPSKPYLYYMIDKSGSVPTTITLEGLKRMGAKPIAFDEKQISISWRPSFLQDTAVNAAGLASQPNKYTISPWLSTNENAVSPAFVPSSVDHLGVYWQVDQQFGGGYGYHCEVEVQFEFKKPIWKGIAGAAAALPAQLATPDASKDGIAETPDL